jgi:hypothetical protein
MKHKGHYKGHYKSHEEKHLPNGSKVVRKVSIKNGQGYKMVTKYHKGKKMGTAKKPIHSSHIDLIMLGKFIPGLFSDCGCNKKKTRKNHK